MPGRNARRGDDDMWVSLLLMQYGQYGFRGRIAEKGAPLAMCVLDRKQELASRHHAAAGAIVRRFGGRFGSGALRSRTPGGTLSNRHERRNNGPFRPPNPPCCRADSPLLSAAAVSGLTPNGPRGPHSLERPPLVTQAVCLARAYAVDAGDHADFVRANALASGLLEGRSDLEGRWVSLSWLGKQLGYVNVREGTGRAVFELPDGVTDDDVIVLAPDPDARLATDRLRDLYDALRGEVKRTRSPDAEQSLWLTANALRLAAASKGLWTELIERSQRLLEFVGPLSSEIPIDHARLNLVALQRDSDYARRQLALDLATASGARVASTVSLAVADADRDRDFDRDAWLRSMFHHLSLSLARNGPTAEPALDEVAARVTAFAIDAGFASEVEGLAQRELAEGSDLIARALDSPDDIDTFYWLLYEAVLPLRGAEILFEVLAACGSGSDRFVRLGNLSEEKRVRATTSIMLDSDNLYTPLLVHDRESVRRRRSADGDLAGRLLTLDLIEHNLRYPRWLEPFLLSDDPDGEEYWYQLMLTRRPLNSTAAPPPPVAEPKRRWRWPRPRLFGR